LSAPGNPAADAVATLQRTPAPVARLWAAVFLGYLALGATLQALPTFMITTLHASAWIAGLAVGIAFGATALSRPFAGRAGDANHARLVVAAGGILVAVGGVGHLVAHDVTTVLAARVVMGAGEAALFSGALPWVLGAAPATSQGRVAGWFGLSMWSGLTLGPLLATVVSSSGDRAVWALVSSLGMASMAVASSTPRQLPVTRRRPVPARRGGGWRSVIPAGAGLPGLVFGLSAYGYGAIASTLVLYLRHERMPGSGAGLTVFAAAFLLARWAGSPLVDCLGGLRIGLIALTMQAAGLALVGFGLGQVAVLCGTAVAGAAGSLMFPVSVDVTLGRIRHAGAGNAIGATTSLWDVGIMAAGPVSGWVSLHSFRAAFAVAAACALAGVALQGCLMIGQHKTRPVAARPLKTPAPGPP
jgi:MFS family permease